MVTFYENDCNENDCNKNHHIKNTLKNKGIGNKQERIGRNWIENCKEEQRDLRLKQHVIFIYFERHSQIIIICTTHAHANNKWQQKRIE